MTKLILALCEGRHEMPSQVNGSIFPNEVDIFDFKGMKKLIHSKLKSCNELDLYVTGLTPALIEVVNYCVYHDIELTLYHFNRDTGDYVPQLVNVFNRPEFYRGADGTEPRKGMQIAWYGYK